jgi:hypothetical protein
MNSYNFTLTLEGDGLLEPEALDAFFEAGCDDASFGERDGITLAEFDRQAVSFSDAVISAVRNVEHAGVGARVLRVEPDDLVSAQVIAERVGRTPESVRLLIKGSRGPGDFPPALAQIDAKTRVWRWSEVADWFATWLGKPVRLGGAPHFAAALNGALEARTQMVALQRIAHTSKSDHRFGELEFDEHSVALLPALVGEAASELQRELAASN